MKAILVLLAIALPFAILSGLTLYGTLTIELKPTDEPLFVCGESGESYIGKTHVSECTDRAEYAWGTAIAAGFAFVSASCLVGALIVVRQRKALATGQRLRQSVLAFWGRTFVIALVTFLAGVVMAGVGLYAPNADSSLGTFVLFLIGLLMVGGGVATGFVSAVAMVGIDSLWLKLPA